MKLYETYFEIERLWDLVAESIDGEGQDEAAILAEIEQKLAEVEDELDTKALKIAAMVKNYRAEAEALKAEKLRLAKRQQSAEKTVEWLSRYLEQFLEPGTKLKDARSSIGWRRSEGVRLTVAPEELPEEYVRVKTEANLSAIKDALKAGDAVDGAILEERQNIQIR
jgi:chromosome segregation ATPase